MLRLTTAAISMASLAILLWAAVPAWAQDDAGEHRGEHAGHDHDDEAGEHARGEHAGGDDPALAACGEFIATLDLDTTARNWKSQVPQPPQFEFDPNAEYFWNLKTNKGDIKVRFLADVAPMHVSSTIYLTELGFYDDIVFHRVIPGFMAQGGDPTGTGSGGPAYKYKGEYDSNVRHDRPGLLSMANTGSEGRGMGGSDGSQFFLTFVPTPHLDGKHTIFGEVVEGMSTVKVLESLGSSPQGKPKEKLFIEQATIEVVAGGGDAERGGDEGGDEG